MLLSIEESQKLLSQYGLLFPKTAVYGQHQGVSFPVALKVDSSKIVHKTDRGWVRLNLNSEAELTHTVMQLESNLKGVKHQWVVQEMVKGVEVTIGMKRDPTFGPVIVFGLGGILVEILKDVSMQLIPLSRKEALRMINSIKGKKLLEGFRGSSSINKETLVQALIQASKLAEQEKSIVEFDFNPVIVNQQGAYVVDARVILC